jgi:heme/copper-type cytochrome/quinol oxidase subunit 2
MTLRLVALSLALVLAVPATIAILRAARGAREPAAALARRRLEALWVAVPVVLLAALIALSAAA